MDFRLKRGITCRIAIAISRAIGAIFVCFDVQAITTTAKCGSGTISFLHTFVLNAEEVLIATIRVFQTIQIVLVFSFHSHNH